VKNFRFSPAKTLRFVPAWLLLAIVGCGQPGGAANESYDVTRVAAAAPGRGEQTKSASPATKAIRQKVAAPSSTAITDGSSITLASATQPGAANIPPATAMSRKIIYDAQVDLVVDSVEPVAQKLASLVQDARGYIAEQNITGSPGSLRSIHWKVRIPVEQFDSFVNSVVSLGELERNNRTSQDVSDQYYDLEARIKNKKVEEQTLNKILQERSGKLEDVLKIEIELSRVRGEIEQLEGKIRVLENLSSLATLTLNIREREKYAPPAPVVAGFGTQISRTWDGSITNLVDLGKAIVLWTVSWAIWVPFYLVGAILAWILGRKLIRAFIRNLPRLIALARTPLTRPRAPTPSE
jgi:Domain of unknown function (DUF4349)